MANIIYPTENSNVPSITNAATAIASNTGRKGWNIQNSGQNALFVLLGSGASTTVWHFVLKAGTANDDGTGGSVSQMSGVVYTSVISIAGTSPRYVATEI